MENVKLGTYIVLAVGSRITICNLSNGSFTGRSLF